MNGAFGEGGGQILRSTLSLSALTGRPVTIENIRAGRSKPGLLRQHLAALRAVAEVCGAEVVGDELGSRRVELVPGAVQPGDYHFAVGSAGSANLVLQTVLPPLMLAEGPSTVIVEGGTHNPTSPTFDFIDRAFFPLLRRLGVGVEGTLVRPGFYQAGGGQIEVRITPPASGRLGALELLERGAEVRRAARALVAHLPGEIARRELSAFSRRVSWPADGLEVVTAHHARGPGNVFMAELEFEQVTEMVTAFGARGVRAEQVGKEAGGMVRDYLKTDAPVGEFLADQLLIPLALGGGVFRTGPLSRHAVTNIEVIRQVLEVELAIEEAEDGVLVRRL